MLGSPVIVLLPVKKRTRCRPSKNPVHRKSNGHDRGHHGRRCRRLVVVVHGHDRDVHHVCTPRTCAPARDASWLGCSRPWTPGTCPSRLQIYTCATCGRERSDGGLSQRCSQCRHCDRPVMTFPVGTAPHERRSGECGGNLAVRVHRPRARVGHASWLVAGRAASHTTLDSTVLRLRVALKKKRRHIQRRTSWF